MRLLLTYFELMRGQGRLDMYLTKRAEKQESSQNIRGTQSQKDH